MDPNCQEATDLLIEKLEISSAFVPDITFGVITVTVNIVCPCRIIFPFFLFILIIFVVGRDVGFLGDFLPICIPLDNCPSWSSIGEDYS